MLAKVFAAALNGFDGQLVEIECDITNGLPSLIIVGLANKAIDEAKERVRGAIKNSGLKTPPKRITLNLAPADLPKDGTAYDLGMAIAILVASGQIEAQQIKENLFIGELALDGNVRPVPGVLAYAQSAKELGFKQIIVPYYNAREASLVSSINIIAIKNLKELYHHLIKETELSPVPTKPIPSSNIPYEYTFESIYGQEQAKRAIEIAAAGNHNLLMTGPPGAGKTMLARALLSILPPPSLEEIIEITKIYSLAGLNRNGIINNRPFRSPHHTASDIALIGGGQNPRPGEISLSHHGVLLLDELPEFKRSVLEVMRQPLEDKIVSVARANRSITYPARFMLIATQNPCPCGYKDDPVQDCNCTPYQVLNYNKKISGPLLDRIDLIVNVGRVEHDKLLKRQSAESSNIVAQRVLRAREQQFNRFNSSKKCNADMSNADIKTYCTLSTTAKNILEQATRQFNLSARSYMRILKVARTIADLDHAINIEVIHLSEALQYRPQSAYTVNQL